MEATTEEKAKEVFETTGAVEAVAQHNPQRYSMKVGGEWYSGFGTCPAEKGVVYVIQYAMNGKFRNIQAIREIGEQAREKMEEFRKAREAQPEENETPAVPLAVKNFRGLQGWHQAAMLPEEEQVIQSRFRDKIKKIVAESLADSRELLSAYDQDAATPGHVVYLAVLMSERRIPHVSRVFEAHMKAKVEELRKAGLDKYARQPGERGMEQGE